MSSFVVILTGSTGNLGTYLLAELANREDIDSIFCLNRSLDSVERQTARLEARGLALSAAGRKKVRSYSSALDKPSLGLNDAVHGELLHHCTHILHCAWPVDFNRSFESFLPNVCGVRSLIQFANQSTHRAHLLFLSSVSAAGNWGAIPGARETVPEAEIDDWKVARLGYGQSKLVAERLLAEAAASLGLAVSICRVGQVAGPIDHGISGSWPTQEWLPSLVASSRCMGKIPMTLGPLDNVDWVPADRLGSIVVELLFSRQCDGEATFYNVVNPRVCRWETLLGTITRSLSNTEKEGRSKSLQKVPFPEWVQALQASSEDTDVAQSPAIKLLDFFESLREKAVYLPRARAVQLDVKQTAQRSPTLRDLEPVQPAWMELWIQQWRNLS